MQNYQCPRHRTGHPFYLISPEAALLTLFLNEAGKLSASRPGTTSKKGIRERI
ncbi:hypothetical protein [Mucilaginibacter antarcticus]|uniref:Uncharacterized protein n=1 Tax=Mucilaginibacter antarcticus TaxID=1855725 RepID=A0ABW5XU48_9SPHI